MNATEIRERLAALGDARRAASSRRFFKTGPGEYGEGDRSPEERRRRYLKDEV